MADKHMPYDLAAEKSVLGACLLEREAIIPIESWLKPEYFYLQKHEHIYQAICALYRRLIPPDLTTVASELQRLNHLEAVGGITFLGELSAECPSAMHVEYYAKVVERCAIQRRWIEVGAHISALGYDQSRDVSATLAYAEEQVQLVARSMHQESTFVPNHISVAEMYEQVQRAVAGEELPFISTGYPDLDSLLGAGFQRQDLITLAARPSVGKTSMALCLAYNIARRGYRVGFISLEMSRTSLNFRLTSMTSGINTQDMKTGRLTPEQMQIFGDTCAKIAQLPIFIDDKPSRTIQDMFRSVERLYANEHVDIVFMDYIQLADSSKRGKNSNRNLEVGDITRTLKAMAKSLDIPVVALSQLSRAVEQREDHIPRLADLRDSGSVEQDSDIVMFLYREELYEKETDKKGLAEVIIAKAREGPIGTVLLRFNNALTRFENLERFRVIA